VGRSAAQASARLVIWRAWALDDAPGRPRRFAGTCSETRGELGGSPRPPTIFIAFAPAGFYKLLNTSATGSCPDSGKAQPLPYFSAKEDLCRFFVELIEGGGGRLLDGSSPAMWMRSPCTRCAACPTAGEKLLDADGLISPPELFVAETGAVVFGDTPAPLVLGLCQRSADEGLCSEDGAHALACLQPGSPASSGLETAGRRLSPCSRRAQVPFMPVWSVKR